MLVRSKPASHYLYGNRPVVERNGRSSVQEAGARSSSPRTDDVARAHDAMVDEYDRLNNLWYAWLFTQLHEFIAARLPASTAEARALDVGCGTGFQSFLLARAGYVATGFDVAERLLDRAREMLDTHTAPPLVAPPLFTTTLDAPWVAEHDARLASMLERARAGRTVVPPRFERGDACSIDYASIRPSVITCCGSVLSFIDPYELAIRRMAEALPAGGSLFLEVEQKASPDLVWPIADTLLRGRLGYEQSLRTSLVNLLAAPGRSVHIDYPFELANGQQLTLPIWLFSTGDLRRAFDAAGLEIADTLGIHQLTNLIPSTLLHRTPPDRTVQRLFERIRTGERRLAKLWPFRRLGSSIVYHLTRRA